MQSLIDAFPHVFSQLFDWKNILDIAAVAFIIYQLLLLIRGTRSVQILVGLCLVILAFFLSDWFELLTLNYILKKFFQVLLLLVVILFQDEIKRGLASIGRNPFFKRNIEDSHHAIMIDEVVKAANLLAGKRIGSLIIIARGQGLKNYIEGSIKVDSKISAELLIAIFQSESPIHDGAVVLQKNRISAAGCFVPVTLESDLDRRLGTRHRAAIGMSQETDALVVVTSEERGEISLAMNGTLIRGLTITGLKDQLYTGFDLIDSNKKPTENDGVKA